jgi:hypothetical protein
MVRACGGTGTLAGGASLAGAAGGAATPEPDAFMLLDARRLSRVAPCVLNDLGNIDIGFPRGKQPKYNIKHWIF